MDRYALDLIIGHFILYHAMTDNPASSSEDSPSSPSRLENLARKVEATEIPRGRHLLELMPVSHNRFYAHWSLDSEALRTGLRVSSADPEHSHLVLRLFSLPMDAHENEFSSVWHDFPIDGVNNNGYFNLPGSADRITAVVGLINRDGRFHPLMRGNTVALPAGPETAPKKEEARTANGDADDMAETQDPVKRIKPPEAETILDESAIRERLASIAGLPEELITDVSEEDLEDSGVRVTGVPIHLLDEAAKLDEISILRSTRQALASDPRPLIEESTDRSKPGTLIAAQAAGSSEQLASQWEDIWSEKAPIQLKAVFILSGRLAEGMQLLIGNERIRPKPGGYFTWRRPLTTFDEAWPLLRASLDTPIAPALPSLEFYEEAQDAECPLEMHGALEIEGQVNDLKYIEHLPPQINPDPNGHFKLTQVLAQGAVILPGLSLLASR